MSCNLNWIKQKNSFNFSKTKQGSNSVVDNFEKSMLSSMPLCPAPAVDKFGLEITNKFKRRQCHILNWQDKGPMNKNNECCQEMQNTSAFQHHVLLKLRGK